MRLILSCLLALIMTACSGGSEPAPVVSADASDQTSASTSAPASDDVAAEEAEIEPAVSVEPTANQAYVSPIGEALGFDPDDQAEFNLNYVRQAEELTRQCMAEAGFDYTPAEVQVSQSQQRLWELRGSLTRDQFLEQYGYGIATLFDLNFREQGVMNFVELLLGPAPTEARSQSEQQAYELALSGESIQGLDADEARDQAFSAPGTAAEGSCRDYGYETAETPDGVIFDGLQSLLGDELSALGERYESDPRIAEERAAWQICMAGFGHSYESDGDIFEELSTLADDIGEAFTSSPEALALFGAAIDANLSGMNAEDRQKFLGDNGAFGGFDMVPDLRAELDALIVRELEIAANDASCSDRDLRDQVLAEVEQQFVEDHADQLALITQGDA